MRPALDLLAQVPEVPTGDIVDLGCGAGAVAADLAARFAGRPLIGVDSSPAMLAEAAETGCYDRLDQADAALWAPHAPPALIFSNALCQWLPDHPGLFARLARALMPGGVLAVQMPRQYDEPSHRLLRDLAADLFPDRFDFTGWRAPVAPPQDYARMLMPLGAVSVWETHYVQVLPKADQGHPVRQFTQSTAMRPFVDKLTGDEAPRFIAAYDDALGTAYPAEPDGTVLFPFQRVFFILTRPN
nr:methyltransferase domain-containing protein [Actibacterium ureilyticum]